MQMCVACGIIKKKEDATMRMSSAKRIELGQQVCEQYESAGLHWHKNVTFVRDMLGRLRAGRGMSAKQRNWFDNIISGPLPDAKNQEIFTALISAANTEGISESKRRTMLDLASSAFLYNLSDKQVGFINSLIEYASEIKAFGPWAPSDDDLGRCKIAIRLQGTRNAFWWSQHAGVSRARDAVWHYLLQNDEGGDFKHFMRDAKFIPPMYRPDPLEPWHVKTLLKSFKTRIDGYLEPKWKVGDDCWFWDRDQAQWHFVTVLDAPEMDGYGELKYLCFVNGVPQHVYEYNMKKNRRK